MAIVLADLVAWEMSSELIPCYVAFCDEHSPVTN